MFIDKKKVPLLLINAVILLIFTVIFATRKNYEFLMYVGVIVFFLLLILYTDRKVLYPLSVLWGLSVWSIMHLVGGGIYIGSQKVYEIILLPIVGDPYQIFRYDQLVHIIGFGVATLLMFHLLKPCLRADLSRFVSLSIVIVMAGLGVGAVNEIVEFIATVTVPETGVGGYINTSLDLVSDLVGAIIAVIYIRKFELNKKSI